MDDESSVVKAESILETRTQRLWTIFPVLIHHIIPGQNLTITDGEAPDKMGTITKEAGKLSVIVFSRVVSLVIFPHQKIGGDVRAIFSCVKFQAQSKPKSIWGLWHATPLFPPIVTIRAPAIA